MSVKDTYRELCEKEDSIPLYSQAWWLDCVCGKSGWEVVLQESGGHIVGALPYVIKKKFGFVVLSMPTYTQTLGVWVRSAQGKRCKKFSKEKSIVESLINQLPKHNVFFQAFHSSFKNWMPLYWMGFEQTTKYSYVIENLQDTAGVWKEVNENIRTDVRKAEKTLRVHSEGSVADFYQLLTLTYERQGQAPPQRSETLDKIINTAISRGSGKLFFAQDNDSKFHSAVFIVWDANSAYYLASGADPELRNSGAGSFCLWEAIKFSATVTKEFDFEGSMVPGIEKYFRSFGGVARPYSRIARYSNPLLALAAHVSRIRSGKI